jgi:DnaJ-class molecular chaperone
LLQEAYETLSNSEKRQHYDVLIDINTLSTEDKSYNSNSYNSNSYNSNSYNSNSYNSNSHSKSYATSARSHVYSPYTEPIINHRTFTDSKQQRIFEKYKEYVDERIELLNHSNEIKNVLR